MTVTTIDPARMLAEKQVRTCTRSLFKAGTISQREALSVETALSRFVNGDRDRPVVHTDATANAIGVALIRLALDLGRSLNDNGLRHDRVIPRLQGAVQDIAAVLS